MPLINYPFSDIKSIDVQQLTTISLDGLLTSVHNLSLPKMRDSKAKDALIYALEDELLQSAETLEFFPNKEKNGTWSVLVVSREVLDNIRQEISEHAINCLALVPEFMFLPLVEDKVSYLEQDDFVLFRTRQFHGGKINKQLFFQHYASTALNATQLGRHDEGFNLLRVNFWQKYNKQFWQFKSSLMLLGVIFMLSLVSLAIDNGQLSKRLNESMAQNKTLFQHVFPGVRVVDLPVQLGNKLSQINKREQALNKGLLLFMSQHTFDDNLTSIRFENQQLQVLK